MKSIDPSQPVPLYHQLFLHLREAIFRGDFAPDSLLPSEAELEKQFEVSRITVRRAIDELSDRGLVRREKGRGTRVLQAGSTFPGIVDSVERMVDNYLMMGLQTEVQLLEFEYVPAPQDAAAALGLEQGAVVQHAVRVRKLRGTPFSHLKSYVPEAVGRRYEREDLSSLPLLALLERSGISVGRANQIISAVAATPELGRALRVAPDSPLLRVERVIYAQNDRPVEYIIASYHPSLYKYKMTLERKSKNDKQSWKSVS